MLPTMIVCGSARKHRFINVCFSRCISSQIFKHNNLNNDLKKEIEEYWIKVLEKDNYFNSNDDQKKKFYALSMFPYPSGSLHIGHVRVYAISDVMARFYRLNGRNVFQPIGWDAFGLPAENAAIERGIPPDKWTRENINHMKEQLKQLHCTFDWHTELTTSSPDYYKWTQHLFLKMYDAGLIYQKEALVNWDPVDCTVLADEQVNNEGKSWRSGAKVEKRILKQWFIRTTKFAKDLYDGLHSQTLIDWDDIIEVQKNWIGTCNGYSFDLKIKESERISDTSCLSVWVPDPLLIAEAAFLLVQPDSLVCIIANNNKDANGKLNVEAVNPFTNCCLPIYVSEDAPYPFARDIHVGVPSRSEFDREFAQRVGLTDATSISAYTKDQICEMARELCIGGYPVSSNIQDWLISRQRYWGTPIPMVHCSKCGTQPVPYNELPVTLPSLPENFEIGKSLNDFLKNSDWKSTVCPKCGGDAFRDTDTMDTFVDSSWYYLRYTDVNNEVEAFDKNVARKLLPVDLYVGGKEHAVLHLYYARFFSYFLHSIGMVEHPEPFQRLLCQGMVKGRTYKTKEGRYLKCNEIIFEGQKAKLEETGEDLEVTYEKMSKSKYNGVDPKDILEEYGVDTTRLLLLFNVNPESHREWNESLFPAVLKWQNRLWITISDFIKARETVIHSSQPDFDLEKVNLSLRTSRNYFVGKTTYHYRITQQLATCISHLQALTSVLRATTKETKAFSEEFEKTLAYSIIMLAPIIPHFAATLWLGFTSAPGRLNLSDDIISWDENLFKQQWPQLDADYEVPIYCQFNRGRKVEVLIPTGKLTTLTAVEALEFVQKDKFLRTLCKQSHISNLELRNFHNLCANFFITGTREKIKSTNV